MKKAFFLAVAILISIGVSATFAQTDSLKVKIKKHKVKETIKAVPHATPPTTTVIEKPVPVVVEPPAQPDPPVQPAPEPAPAPVVNVNEAPPAQPAPAPRPVTTITTTTHTRTAYVDVKRVPVRHTTHHYATTHHYVKRRPVAVSTTTVTKKVTQ